MGAPRFRCLPFYILRSGKRAPTLSSDAKAATAHPHPPHRLALLNLCRLNLSSNVRLGAGAWAESDTRQLYGNCVLARSRINLGYTYMATACEAVAVA